MSDLEKSYYIGKPEKPNKIGQDKYGMVHCLLWLMIYKKGKFFAKENEYTIGVSGGGLGQVKSIKEGQKKLFLYAKERLKNDLKEAKNKVERIEEAIEQLGNDFENLEKFIGDYKSEEERN